MKRLTSILALAATALAVSPIVVKEQEFIDTSTHNRFVVIGVDYQPGGQGAYGASNSQDPLNNATVCLRDAALMQQLGVNTIRSYNVDPTLNHDECASIFNSVGIYMILDVNSPLSGQSIDRSDPSSSYNTAYLIHIFSVVEAFKSYPNTLGFFAGNEIINDVPTGHANPPYIRAVQRDLKNYISAHADRAIPVGYSAADVREVLQDTWAYLQCDNSGSSGKMDISRSDFFGLNSYSWCGSTSSYQISGYDQLVQIFSKTTVPVFLSEYGCNKPEPRLFNEVPVLYGPQMTVMSGGLVYEWTQEASNFGIIQAYDNGTAQLMGDYDRLAAKYDTLNITLIETSNSTATKLQPPQCNSNLISNDGFSTDFNIPHPPHGADALISSGVSNAPSSSIVAVTQTSVQVAIYATNGGQISGLQIKPAVGANHPGQGGGLSTGAVGSGGASQTGTPTGSGAASSATKANGADRSVIANGVVVGAALGLGLFAL